MPFRIGKLILWSALLYAGSALSLVAQADLLRFHNGDRLTGTLVKETETHFIFKTATLGELSVAKKDARLASAAATAPPVETLVGVVPIKDVPDKPASPPQKKAKEGPIQKPDPSQAEQLAEVIEAPNPWAGKIEFGLRQQQGSSDLLTFDLRGSANRTIGDNDLIAKARLLYGEQDGEVNNDRYDASFQWRRELGKRTFAQSLTSYFADNLKDINRNWEQNFGAGYRLIDLQGHVVNLGGGLTGQYREATFSPSGFFALAELFQDYTYRLNQKFTFKQTAQIQYSPDGGTKFLSASTQPSAVLEEATNYKVRFDTVLQGKITDDLSLNLRFEFEYDNAVQPRSARTDQRIISSLGYAF